MSLSENMGLDYDGAANKVMHLDNGEYLLTLDIEWNGASDFSEAQIRGSVINYLIDNKDAEHEGVMRAGAYIGSIDVDLDKPNRPIAITYIVDANKSRIQRAYQRVKNIYPFVAPEIAQNDGGVSNVRAVVLEAVSQSSQPVLQVV